jgi:hypothetical protein
MILAMNVLSFALLAMTGVTADGLVRALFYHPAWFLLVCSIITLCSATSAGSIFDGTESDEFRKSSGLFRILG